MAMDTKNFCTALGPKPHSESRVSEWHRAHGLWRRWHATAQDSTLNITSLGGTGGSAGYFERCRTGVIKGVQARCGLSTRCLW